MIHNKLVNILLNVYKTEDNVKNILINCYEKYLETLWIQVYDEDGNKIENYQIKYIPTNGENLIRKIKIGTKRAIKSGKYIYSKGHIMASGLLVSLNNKHKFYHILLCSSVYGPRPTLLYTVDHINRNNLDNHPDNLRWADKSEQSRNRNKYINEGLRRRIIGISPNGTEHIFTGTRDAAKELNLQSSGISRVLTGKIKHTGNWVFEYEKLEENEGERWMGFDDLEDIHHELSSDQDITKIIDAIEKNKYLFSNHGNICELKNNTKICVNLKTDLSGRRKLQNIITSRIFAFLFLPEQIKKYIDKSYKFKDLEVNHIKDSRQKGDKSIERAHDLEVLTVQEHRKKDAFSKPIIAIKDNETREFIDIFTAANILNLHRSNINKVLHL
jgi:hypothetical protein